jgi:hypothetical protein
MIKVQRGLFGKTLTLEAADYSATIDVSVNGSALTPLGFSYGNPRSSLVTDTIPITDIGFTIVNARPRRSMGTPPRSMRSLENVSVTTNWRESQEAAAALATFNFLLVFVIVQTA